MLRRIPNDLPLFGALLLGLSFLAFAYTGFYVDGQIGRPSSTSGIALLFIPIWGALATIVGLIVGFIVRAIWRRAKEPLDQQRRTWALVGILSGAVLLSAGAGALDVIRYEQQAKPRLRLDTGLIVREIRADSATPVRISQTLYDSDRQPGELSWGSNRSELVIGDDSVEIRDKANGRRVRFLTSALDYITRVDAVPLLRSPEAQPLLAIVISGRATGRRAVIAIIDYDYKPVFEEQVERFWELRDTPLEVRATPTTRAEYVVVGPACAKSLILRPRHAA